MMVFTKEDKPSVVGQPTWPTQPSVHHE